MKSLGILELENKPMQFPGGLSVPGTFDFPVERQTVVGAFTKDLVAGDRSAEESYVRSARHLERRGVSAIISNCGYSAVFQGAVAAAVSVPVAMSSLSMVPFVAKTAPAGAAVGIITFDSRTLSEHHFLATGWSSHEFPVVVAGIEGTETWQQLNKTEPFVVLTTLIEDVTSAVESLLQAHPAVGALVFECAGFVLAAETVRRDTGMPVTDCASLAKMLIETSPPQR